MKIVYSGFTMADLSAGLPPREMTLNGSRVVELVDFARAGAKKAFSRGNSSTVFSFSTSREFGNYADAQDFYFLAESQLPKMGDLIITQTGAAAGRTPVVLPGAALALVAPVWDGVRVGLTLTFQGGSFQGGLIPGIYFDPDTPTTMFGIIPIPSGSATVPVVFPANQPNPVITGLTLIAPAGATGPGLLGAEQLTNAGFVARLSAPVSADGFSLQWEVKQGQP